MKKHGMRGIFAAVALAFVLIAGLFTGTASAVEVEKLTLDVSTATSEAFEADNLHLKGGFKLALFHDAGSGGALGVSVEPDYAVGAKDLDLNVGVFFRPFDGIEAYASKPIDANHFGGQLNMDNVTVGVRVILIDDSHAFKNLWR